MGPRAGDVAPSLSGTSLQGHPISVGDWRGSVVVLVFWASWCVPCQAEQPALDALARQVTPSGVHFAGVSVDADAAAAKAYLVTYSVPYDSLIDSSQDIVYRFEVVGPPTTFVIGKNGRVANEMVGEVSIDSLGAAIATARAAP